MLRELIGQELVELRYDGFDDLPLVMCGVRFVTPSTELNLYNVYELRDFYDEQEEIGVWYLRRERGAFGVSAAMTGSLSVRKVVHAITLVQERQRMYRHDEQLCDNYVTRGLIFDFDDGQQLSVEKDSDVFDSMLVEQGANVIDTFVSIEDFCADWDPAYNDEMEPGMRMECERVLLPLTHAQRL